MYLLIVVLLGAVHALLFDNGGYGYVVAAGSQSTWIRELFKMSVHECSPGNLVIFDKPNREQRRLEPPRPTAYYPETLHQGEVMKMKVWKLHHMATPCNLWWELPSLLKWFACDNYKKNQFFRNNLTTWSNRLAPILAPRLCLRRSVDRCSNLSTTSFDRCLPESAASTFGLLFVLADRVVSSQWEGKDAAESALATFVAMHLTADNPTKIFVNANRTMRSAVCGKCVRDDFAIVIDITGGVCDLRPLLEVVSGEPEEPLIQSLMMDRARPGGFKTQWSVSGVLVRLVSGRDDYAWLTRQFIGGVALAIDVAFEKADHATNPAATTHQLDGGRWDQTLIDHLAMGQGMEPSARGAVNVDSHMNAYFTLVAGRTAKGKKRRFSVSTAKDFICNRYQYVGKRWMAKCSNFCLSMDATRLGGRDTMAMALMGLCEEGDMTMWVNPQARFMAMN